MTSIGHEAVAHPTGTLWTGDFSFPHQVENPTNAQRVVLAIDVLSGPGVRRLLPLALAEAAAIRVDLAREARNRLLRWRAGWGKPTPTLVPAAETTTKSRPIGV